MTRMHNPPHPGEVLWEYWGDITVTEAAAKLGVNRVTLSRVGTGSAGVSADMAYRLADAFGISPELWAGMQLQYDMYQAGKVKRSRIERLAAWSPPMRALIEPSTALRVSCWHSSAPRKSR